MKQFRQTKYYQRKIDELTKTIHNLESEKLVLSHENESLRKVITSNENTINTLKEEIGYMQERFNFCIDELRDAQQEYFEASKLMQEIKKKYTEEIENLLARIRKQR